DDRLNALLAKEREFAENSPMPPPEIADQGVYCTGDDCHKIRPKWERPIDELLPPKSCVDPVWIVKGFGSGGASSGGIAPIHFGDVPAAAEKATAPKPAKKAQVQTKAYVTKKSAKKWSR
ncbi:MAG TPA: hypothetical protein VEI54_02525, partial [Candidatus Limnocylindrales bacterium]|nr:hypothetical protein [Candidatus Limnocylindrales bacterium]